MFVPQGQHLNLGERSTVKDHAVHLHITPCGYLKPMNINFYILRGFMVQTASEALDGCVIIRYNCW